MPPEAAEVKDPAEVKAAEQAAKIAADEKIIKETPQDVLKRFFGVGDDAAKPKPTTDPKDKPATDPKPAPKAGEKKPAAKKPAPKPAPKPEPVAPAEPDYEAIAAAAARGVGEALKPKEPAKEAAPSEDAFLDEEGRELLPTLRKMEEMHPERYKGLTGKYIANSKAVSEYQAKWEKEHEGETFDPEAEEHNAFYAKHTVDWRDGDENAARAKMAVEAETRDIRNTVNTELADLRMKEQARVAEPSIIKESTTVDHEIFKLAGGDFKDLLDANGQVNAEVMAKIQADDPVAAEVIFPAVMGIRAHAQEILRLDRGLVRFDPEKPMHKWIQDFATRQEQDILALPKTQQVDANGKKFSRSEDYWEMTPKQQAKHYRLTGSDLNALLTAEQGTATVKRANIARDNFNATAAKLGYVKSPNAPKSPAAKPAASAPKKDEAEEEEEPASPSISGGETIRPGMPVRAQPPGDGAASLFSRDRGW